MLPDANSVVPSHFAICQVCTERNGNVSFNLDNCCAIKLFVVLCQVLRKLIELFYSVKPSDTSSRGSCVFQQHGPNLVSYKQKMQIQAEFLEFVTAHLILYWYDCSNIVFQSKSSHHWTKKICNVYPSDDQLSYIYNTKSSVKFQIKSLFQKLAVYKYI